MEPMKILTGRAGQMLPEWKAAVKYCHDHCLSTVTIVPEQYTLQAERELLDALKTPGLLTDEVLSPSRLQLRVFDQVGQPVLPPLDDLGRQMAVSCAMRDVKQKLSLYQSAVDQLGMPARIAELLTEFERAMLTPDSLRQLAKDYPDAALTGKRFRELALIWQAYHLSIDGRFTDAAAQQKRVAEQLCRSRVLEGACVFVYGFDMLQPPFCRILLEAMRSAYSVTVLMISSPQQGDGYIFAAQEQSLNALKGMLAHEGLPYETIVSGVSGAEKAPGLKHLEENLFSRSASVMTEVCPQLEIHQAGHPHSEAAYAADTLRRWHESGIPWSRIALALPGGSDLDGILSVTLRAAGIPFHITRKNSAHRHGLCRMLNSSVHAAANNLKREDMINAARSGFTLLTPSEAMQLENYCIEHNIRGSKWQIPFTQGKNAEAMEPLRQKLTAPILRLMNAMRSSQTAEGMVSAVFALLQDTKAYERLMEREQFLLDRQLTAEADSNRQIWRIVVDLLDQLHGILAGRKPNSRELADLLETGLEGAEISVLPPQSENVLIGDAGHLMTGELDALIVMGLQDTATSVGTVSLINERERTQLSGHSLHPVGLSHPTQCVKRLSDFYRTLSLPAERMMLSYSSGSQNGAGLRRSVIISNAERCLPGCTRTGGLKDPDQPLPLSPQLALQLLPAQLKQCGGDPFRLQEPWGSALVWLLRSEKWGDLTRSLLHGFDAPQPLPDLPPQIARRLYRDDTVSISRLQLFAACPYSHFVKYGLKPQVLKEYGFDQLDKGNFLHHAMERYAGLAGSDPSWPDLSEQRIDELVEEAMKDDVASWQDGPLTEDALSLRDGEKLKRIARISARAYTRHARDNGFHKVDEELTFGGQDSHSLPPLPLHLKGGHTVLLQGKIDRVDLYQNDDASYVRVIDYKSSDHSLDPARIWLGTQLQLLMYLQAAADGLDNSDPAGAFYFHLHDPRITLESLPATTEELQQSVEKKLMGELHLKGITLSDVSVLRAMKEGEQDGELPAMLNKDGSISKRSSSSCAACTMEDLQFLLQFTRSKACELAEGIFSGRIDAAPQQGGTYSPCSYCTAALSCPLDHSLAGLVHQVDKMQFSDLLNSLREQDESQTE